MPVGKSLNSVIAYLEYSDPRESTEDEYIPQALSTRTATKHFLLRSPLLMKNFSKVLALGVFAASTTLAAHATPVVGTVPVTYFNVTASSTGSLDPAPSATSFLFNLSGGVV